MKSYDFLKVCVVFMAICLFLLPTEQIFGAGEQALETCAGIEMAKAARNGIIAWGVGFALNKGMESLFPGSGAPTKRDIQELKRMLSHIQEQITHLSNQLSGAKQEILAAIDRIGYNIGSQRPSIFVGLVLRTFRELSPLLKKDPKHLTPGEKKDLKLLMERIKTKIEPNWQGLHTMVYGNPTGKTGGLYKWYADKLRGEIHFLNKTNFQDEVKKFLLYYNQIQATAYYLSVEYYHYAGNSKHYIKEQTDALKRNSRAEMKWFNTVTPIPGHIYINAPQRLMIYLPPFWRNTMRVTRGDIIMIACPQAYFNQGMTADILMLMSKVYTMNWYNRRFLGFKNWRFPSKSEIDHMFHAPAGVNHGAYARSKGLKPMLDVAYIPVWMDPAVGSDRSIERQWSWANKHWDDHHYGFWHYNVQHNSYGWLQWKASNGLNAMPVRKMAHTEKYYW
ncbi:hypothetical protein KAJ27_00285 [bacterium]|nr:hypothetical protein [bacterium]